MNGSSRWDISFRRQVDCCCKSWWRHARKKTPKFYIIGVFYWKSTSWSRAFPHKCPVTGYCRQCVHALTSYRFSECTIKKKKNNFSDICLLWLFVSTIIIATSSCGIELQGHVPGHFLGYPLGHLQGYMPRTFAGIFTRTIVGHLPGHQLGYILEHMLGHWLGHLLCYFLGHLLRYLLGHFSGHWRLIYARLLSILGHATVWVASISVMWCTLNWWHLR